MKITMKTDIFLFAAWTIVLTSCGIFLPSEHTEHNIETVENRRGIETYVVNSDTCGYLKSRFERQRVMFDHFMDEWNGRHIPHRWDTIRCGDYALRLQSLLDSVGQRAIAGDVLSQDQIVKFYSLMVDPFVNDQNIDRANMIFFKRGIRCFLYPIETRNAVNVLFDLMKPNRTPMEFGFNYTEDEIIVNPFGYSIYLNYVKPYIYRLEEGRDRLPYLKEVTWYEENQQLPKDERFDHPGKYVLHRTIQVIKEHNLREKVLQTLDR